MTSGPKGTTLSGIRIKKIEKLRIEIKRGKFRFSPCLQVEIPKANGKLRKLGISDPFPDKIVQKALQIVLELI